MLKFIVLSDLHIVPEGKLSHGLDTHQRLETGIDFINRHHSDAAFVVIDGDLADLGELDAYIRFEKALTKLQPKAILTLGNHDDRPTFIQHFGPNSVNSDTGCADHVIDQDDHKVIVMDTSVPGLVGGRLEEAQLSWLQTQLAAANNMPVIIVMHHNIAPFHVPTDDIILENAESFAQIVTPYKNLRQIISGHVHMSVSGTFHGVPFCTIAGGHYNIEPKLGIAQSKGSQNWVPRREGPAQLAVVLSDDKSTIVHMENYIDRHLVLAPELFNR